MNVNAYLNFNGNCEEAFRFYQSVFGGEFSYVGRYSEMPADPNQPPMSEEAAQKIMHISLPVGESTIMGCDIMPGFAAPFVQGNSMSLSVNTQSEEEAKKVFEGLSAGGTVAMPLEKTFWNAYFGMLIDKFGVHWMVNCDLGQS